MMAPFSELAPMTPDEVLDRNIKIHNAIQWVWRILVIAILVFQMVNLFLFSHYYDSSQAMLKAQSNAIAYLLDVTVDKSTIDPVTKSPTPWIVEIYRKLSAEIDKDEAARTKMVSQMQAYTDRGDERQQKNAEFVLEQKKNTEEFGTQLDAFSAKIEKDLTDDRTDRESWAKALLASMMKVEQSSASIKRKVEQKIINPSDVAPVYHENRSLKRENQQLKKQKQPKIWPWQ